MFVTISPIDLVFIKNLMPNIILNVDDFRNHDHPSMVFIFIEDIEN